MLRARSPGRHDAALSPVALAQHSAPAIWGYAFYAIKKTLGSSRGSGLTTTGFPFAVRAQVLSLPTGVAKDRSPSAG